MTKIIFCGDPHGVFEPIHDQIAESDADAVVLLGDMGLERPIDEEFTAELDAGIRVFFIPGNHDYDSDTLYSNLFVENSRCENIHGRVIDIDGVRVAGLGGNFQGTIWNPKDEPEPRYPTRDSFMRTLKPQMKWKKGLPRKRRGAIWREDIDKLSIDSANILVTHEAPSCHRHGSAALDDLAKCLGVHTHIHGHHHYDYEDTIGDITVIGVDKGSAWTHDHSLCLGHGRKM